MAKTKKKNGLSGGEKVGIGVALTAAAAAAAGSYFLYGSPDAAKNRKKVKSWSLKAKGEILEAVEKAKNISAEEYQRAVEKAVEAYERANDISKNELSAFRKEMMTHWRTMQGNAKKAKGTAKKVVKKAAKKATTAKKTAKKAVKKVAKKVSRR